MTIKRSLDEMMSALPDACHRKIEARAAELIAESESLKTPHQLAECSPEKIAALLEVKQSSVHKIEKQTDFYRSTSCRYVEAAGGILELRVELPGKRVMHLTGVGDLHA